MKLKWTLFILLTLIFTGCKQEEWKDWKIHNEAWLVQNATQEGIIKTHTGLQYKVIRPGIGNQRPDDLKQVLINYRGTLITGIDANGDLIAGQANRNGSKHCDCRVCRRTKKNAQIRQIYLVYPLPIGLLRIGTRSQRYHGIHTSLLYLDIRSGID